MILIVIPKARAPALIKLVSYCHYQSDHDHADEAIALEVQGV